MPAERKQAFSGLPARKLALIHVAKTQLGMCDEDYRALLLSAAGVHSARDLPASGFDAVMRRFAALGFCSRQRQAAQALPPHVRATDGERPAAMATPQQLEAIRAMWASWYGQPDEWALSRWMKQRYGVSALRFCSVLTAQKAIEGLKAMLARPKRPARQTTQTTYSGRPQRTGARAPNTPNPRG